MHFEGNISNTHETNHFQGAILLFRREYVCIGAQIRQFVARLPFHLVVPQITAFLGKPGPPRGCPSPRPNHLNSLTLTYSKFGPELF